MGTFFAGTFGRMGLTNFFSKIGRKSIMIINLATVNWGPQFFVPTIAINKYCGCVLFRANLNDDLLQNELESLNLSGGPTAYGIVWHIREKGTQTWIKIGESVNRVMDFSVRLDTAEFEDGKYQILGFLSVTVYSKGKEIVVSRQSIAEFEIKN
jgi:hypothetical protein